MTYPRVLATRFSPDRQRRGVGRFVIVTDDDGHEVLVRWRLTNKTIWHCADCGPLTTASCMHTFSAALVLAEEYLGLTRVLDLTETTSSTIPERTNA